MGKEKKTHNIEIGKRIQQARRAAAMTQENLSEFIGVTPQYLSDLERGVVGASIPTLISICRALHVSSDYLLFGESCCIGQQMPSLSGENEKMSSEHANLLERALQLVADSIRAGRAEVTPPPENFRSSEK